MLLLALGRHGVSVKGWRFIGSLLAAVAGCTVSSAWVVVVAVCVAKCLPLLLLLLCASNCTYLECSSRCRIYLGRRVDGRRKVGRRDVRRKCRKSEGVGRKIGVWEVAAGGI